MSKERKKIVDEIRRNGFTQVNARDSLKWKRRETLRVMEDEGIVTLNTPSFSSLLTYSAGANFPEGCD